MIYTRRCCTARAALLTAVTAAMLGTGIGYAQEDLAAAKTLYVNASYEEALGMLDRQAAAGVTGARAAELHHYRALCLIALGRTEEADQAIALSVAADPFSVPDTSELSPRVASAFAEARARLIPDVARASLAEGRTLMQKGDAAAANKWFEAVTKMLSEPGLAGRADLTDLTLAATAFTELTRAQMAASAAAAKAAAAPAPPSAPAVSPAAASPAAGTPVAPTPAATAQAPAPATNAPATNGASTARTAAPPTTVRTGAQPVPAGAELAAPPPSARPAAPAAANDSNFVPAVPISQVLPPWQPGSGAFAQLGFQGAVRVTIDATGKVTGAVMERPTYPPYDRLVLAAARNWTYRPATRDGKPVNSERLVEIVLRPRSN